MAAGLEMETALRNEVEVSIVVDMLVSQVLEEFVEVAKLIQHGQLVDSLNVASKF